MRRGDVVIAADRGEFSTKPRPYVVVQRQNSLPDWPTVTVCPITTVLVGAGLFRLAVLRTEGNGLDEDSEIEIDRVTTIRARRVRKVVGTIGSRLLTDIDTALRLWLDL